MMKILYHILYPNGMGDDRFIYDGYKFAFEDLGHVVVPLTEKDNFVTKLKEVRPDVFITALHHSGRLIPFISTIKDFRRKGGAVFLHSGNITPAMVESDKKYRDWVDIIRNNLLADVYYTEVETPYFTALTGRECFRLPLAADKRRHFPTAPSERYKCDIIYVGANLPMKKSIFERRLYPLFKKYRVKVFGGDWDVVDKFLLHPLAKVDRAINLGGVFSRWRINRQVPLDEENVAYSSAKIALNFHEQYGNDHLFLNARGFKIPASGGFEICDWMPPLRSYFNENEIIMPKSDGEFFGAVDYYLSHEKERREMQERATKRALREHTWHNRAQTMLQWLKNR